MPTPEDQVEDIKAALDELKHSIQSNPQAQQKVEAIKQQLATLAEELDTEA